MPCVPLRPYDNSPNACLCVLSTYDEMFTRLQHNSVPCIYYSIVVSSTPWLSNDIRDDIQTVFKVVHVLFCCVCIPLECIPYFVSYTTHKYPYTSTNVPPAIQFARQPESGNRRAAFARVRSIVAHTAGVTNEPHVDGSNPKRRDQPIKPLAKVACVCVLPHVDSTHR